MKQATTTGFSRRGALQGLGAAAASLGLGFPRLSAQDSPAARNLWVSLAAYSVRQALTNGQMDLQRFVSWCSELGLAGTELTSYYFPKEFDSGYLRKLRNHAYRLGVTISGTAVRNDFCRPPGPEKDKDIAHVKQWIDYASDLWAPHIRIFAGNLREGVEKSQGITWVADGVKAVLDHAAQRGIMIGLENHGGITLLAEDLLAICREVGEHPWFGVNLDTGNYQKDPYREVEMTLPHAVNVQVKVEMREGNSRVPADIPRICDLLIKSGYKGWVALEYEASADPLVEVPKYVRMLKDRLEG